MADRSRWWLLVVGIVAYVIALVATAPATLLDGHLQRASQGRVRLAEARGTLWSGAGRLEIREAAGRDAAGCGIGWRVVPASLLRGRLVYEVGTERAGSTFPVTVSGSGIEVANADMSLPAAALGLGVPKLAPLGLTGEVLVHVGRLVISADRVTGNAVVRWRAAGSALSPLSPLGEYELRVESADMRIEASLITLAGPLELDGRGSWRQGDSVAFLATARVPPQHREKLAPLLRLIAVERSKGNFELQLK